MRAIFTIDPGVHTGIAWAVVDETAPTIQEAIKNRLHRGSETIIGEPMQQARTLWGLWEDWKRLAVGTCLLDPDKVDLVIEDFVLRGGQHAAGRDGTAPERVAYAFEGYRNGRHDTYRTRRHLSPIIWQNPSQAARWATKERLTNADAWIKGREHERSAMSHMLLRVAVLKERSQFKNA